VRNGVLNNKKEESNKIHSTVASSLRDNNSTFKDMLEQINPQLFSQDYSMIEKLIINNLLLNASNGGTQEQTSPIYRQNYTSAPNINFQPQLNNIFQKEMIKYIINSFCDFLRKNNYTIAKNDELRVLKENLPSFLFDEGENNSISLQDEMINTGKEIQCPHKDRKHYAKVRKQIYYIEYV
jgi:hypothetical protein